MEYTSAEDHAPGYHEPPHPKSVFDNFCMRTCVLKCDDEWFLCVSADVSGVSGEGESVEEAIDDFRSKMKTMIAEEAGGVFVKASSPAYQMNEAEIYTRLFAAEGIRVLLITHHEVDI